MLCALWNTAQRVHSMGEYPGGFVVQRAQLFVRSFAVLIEKICLLLGLL